MARSTTQKAAAAADLPETCGRIAVTVAGECRQRLLHPDEWSCQRCVGVRKPSLEVIRPPAESAAHAAWVDFAVACGAGRQQAEVQSKSELIDEFSARLAMPTPEPETETPPAVDAGSSEES